MRSTQNESRQTTMRKTEDKGKNALRIVVRESQSQQQQHKDEDIPGAQSMAGGKGGTRSLPPTHD